ncbi:MAG: 50S ribosomal protein L32 [Deltaproteobacteria bacterium]
MAVPKRRTSRAKRDRRRAHDSLTAAQPGTCPNCGGTVQSHRACPSCGRYRDRQVTKATKD